MPSVSNIMFGCEWLQPIFSLVKQIGKSLIDLTPFGKIVDVRLFDVCNQDRMGRLMLAMR